MSVRMRPALVLVLVVLLGVSALACQVPVFRYALERWDADNYEVYVLTSGPLSKEDEKKLLPLRKLSEAGKAGMTRITLTVLGSRQPNVSDPRLKRWLKNRADSKSPRMAVFYPWSSNAASTEPVFAQSLTAKAVDSIANSPARDELRNRLAAGHSAVWILVLSGVKQKDDAAKSRLEAQLSMDQKRLELPTPEELEIEASVLANAKIKLQIKFSVLTIRRDDPQEAFLLSTLINSESDLAEFDEPMAFPVFGRGRVLYALVGKGIAAHTIGAASAFVVGPCSCQVKEQNPGFDLLLNADWAKAIGDTLVSEPIAGRTTDRQAGRRLTIPPGR